MTNEISIFVDESGNVGETSQFYLITFVLHEQQASIQSEIVHYEQLIQDARLPDICMHLGPLLNGHDDYEAFPVETRKQLMTRFLGLVQHLPFKYFTLEYEKSKRSLDLFNCMKRDLINELFNNLAYLQGFDKVKIYYDNGQEIVTKALHDAIEYALAKNAIIYKDTTPKKYRLFQVADFI